MDNRFLLWFSQLVFGLVQGLTEIFPISSSAHIAISQSLWASFTGQDAVAFSTSVFLHLGSFVAILLFYRRDIALLWHSAVRTILRRSLRWQNGASNEHPLGQQTPFYIVMSLLVTSILGLSLEGPAASVFNQPLWSAGALTVNGLWLLFVAWYIRWQPEASRDIADLDWWCYLVLGAVQGVAVLPGLSRFGLMLTIGLLYGMRWSQALKLSFLLSLPTVLAAGGLELYYHVPTVWSFGNPFPILLGIAAAGFGTGAAIRILRREDLHAQQVLALSGSYCMAAGPFYFLYFSYLWA